MTHHVTIRGKALLIQRTASELANADDETRRNNLIYIEKIAQQLLSEIDASTGGVILQKFSRAGEPVGKPTHLELVKSDA